MSDEETLAEGIWRTIKRGVLMRDLDEEEEY